jgi:hypothetical protein
MTYADSTTEHRFCPVQTQSFIDGLCYFVSLLYFAHFLLYILQPIRNWSVHPVNTGVRKVKANPDIKPKIGSVEAISSPTVLSTGGSRGRVRQADCDSTTKLVLVLAAGLLKMHQYHVHPCPTDMRELCIQLWLKAAEELGVEMEPTPEIVKNVRSVVIFLLAIAYLL